MIENHNLMQKLNLVQHRDILVNVNTLPGVLAKL